MYADAVHVPALIRPRHIFELAMVVLASVLGGCGVSVPPPHHAPPPVDPGSWIAMASVVGKNAYGHDLVELRMLPGGGGTPRATVPAIVDPTSAAFAADGSIWVIAGFDPWSREIGVLWRVVAIDGVWRATAVGNASGRIFVRDALALHGCTGGRVGLAASREQAWSGPSIVPCVTGPDGESRPLGDGYASPVGWSEDGSRAYWVDDTAEPRVVRSAPVDGGATTSHGVVPRWADVRMSADGTTLSWAVAPMFERSAIISRPAADPTVRATRIDMPAEVYLVSCVPSPTADLQACAAIDRTDFHHTRLRVYGVGRDGDVIAELSAGRPVVLFSPDGDALLFHAEDADRVGQVYRVDVDGGDLVQLTEDGGLPLAWR